MQHEKFKHQQHCILYSELKDFVLEGQTQATTESSLDKENKVIKCFKSLWWMSLFMASISQVLCYYYYHLCMYYTY